MKKIYKGDYLSDIHYQLQQEYGHEYGPIKVKVSLPYKKRRKLKTYSFECKTYCECCGPEVRIYQGGCRIY